MCACGGKCMRPGPITSNGYLNFLREYRQKNCGLTPVETVKRGARAWNRLTCEQKAKFRRMGCKKKRRKRSKSRKRCGKKRKKRRKKKNRCGKKRRSRSRSRRRKSACRKRKRSSSRKKKKKCMRPGPVTNNGYLNFLRWFRKCHCGLSPQETVRRGARKWCSLPESEKQKFSQMGCKRKRKRKKRRRSRKRRGKKRRC